MCSSVVVVHPPQGWTSCSFWDTSRFTTVVKRGYLSNRSLSVSPQIVWLFSSDLSRQKGVSVHRTAAQWMFFVFKFFLLVKTETVESDNPRRSVLEMFKPTMYLHNFRHYTAATWLADWKTEWISRCAGVPNKVLIECGFTIWQWFRSGHFSVLGHHWESKGSHSFPPQYCE